jgi:pimeloyl-ACP methyl ester carboxylesterase
VGPGGAWGEGLALDVLAVHLRTAARVYAEVEASVTAVMAGVRAGADLAARGGWLTDGSATPTVTAVEPTLVVERAHGFRGAADLVAAGEGLGGGRVRVVEVVRGDGGSAWVLVVPGTQEWSPRAGANPFDLTSDVRAVTGGATVAAAGVAAALDAVRSRAGSRSTPGDPVVLVGHSQGGILAAALASDPGFRSRHRVSHVVTSGSPVGLFPVPPTTRVLSVEHGDDPVPRLDLGPNPDRTSWVTVRTRGGGPPVDLGSHALEGYVATLRVAEGAPRGTVAGLDAWQASAGGVLGRPVRSVSELRVERGWQTPPS